MKLTPTVNILLDTYADNCIKLRLINFGFPAVNTVCKHVCKYIDLIKLIHAFRFIDRLSSTCVLPGDLTHT